MEWSSVEENKAHILEGSVLSEIIKRAFQSGDIYMSVDGQIVLREAGGQTQVIRNMMFYLHVRNTVNQTYLADPGEARGCSTKTFVIN